MRVCFALLGGPVWRETPLLSIRYRTESKGPDYSAKHPNQLSSFYSRTRVRMVRAASNSAIPTNNIGNE